MSYILVTGGLGYIGSHLVIELLAQELQVIIVDNLSNSKLEVLQHIHKITSRAAIFYQLDLLGNIDAIFTQYKIDTVIHLAGLKSSSQSISTPIQYYINNVTGSLNLINTMQRFGVYNLIFSSSATVYADSDQALTESSILNPKTPYGRSKYFVECMINDLYCTADWRLYKLRYFNPIGLHKSGLLQDNSLDNLMPHIIRTVSDNSTLEIFGDTYNTRDGTGIRDYIHIADLVAGHVAALNHLKQQKSCNFAVNLGTGVGYSVLDVVHAFEHVHNIKINYKIMPRRDGDVAVSYADASYASCLFNWRANYTLLDMCRDSFIA